MIMKYVEKTLKNIIFKKYRCGEIFHRGGKIVTNGPYKNTLQKDVTHEGILTH